MHDQPAVVQVFEWWGLGRGGLSGCWRDGGFELVFDRSCVSGNDAVANDRGVGYQTQMHTDQPFFRFNPNAYAEGRSFQPSQEVCEVCSRPSVWQYNGSIYAAAKPIVCARCIAEDRLGAFLTDHHFALHDIEIFDAEPALAKEVLQRTPGIDCFNPYE
ncbi:CbrC family protein [Novosphingobium sp.]|uniref:CbrC family protein n=1 Tax=Novosphingobium sp. TaxID=1874826 RepID=UPI00261BCB40|nr:CbrC family protein [Novosphingobium sp.]